MKRTTLIGPILLILLGALLLLKNLDPSIPMLRILGTAWPFLLIAWGGLRLIEILYGYSQDKPLPAAGVSGYEWATIVLVTLIGTAAWGAHEFANREFGRIRVGGMEVFGQNFEYPLDQAPQKAGKTPRVVIESQRGATRIIGADTDEVKVTGSKSIRAMDKGLADQAHAATPIEVTTQGDTVTIRTSTDRADNARVSSDLEITVPKGAIIEAKGRTVDYDISEVNGNVTVNTEKGGVRLLNIGGKVVIDNRNSDIIRATNIKGDLELKGRGRDIEIDTVAGQLSIDGSYSGESSLKNIAKPVRFQSKVSDIRFERLPGEMDMTLSRLTATNVVGPVQIKTESKDVELSDVTDAITIDVERGDVEIHGTKGPMAKIDVKVGAGAIDVALPAAAKFTIDASTGRGEIVNDFNEKLTVTEKDRGGTITGSLGAGPEVRLRTNRGELSVRRATPPEPAAPEAPKKAAAPKAVPVPPPPRADNQ